MPNAIRVQRRTRVIIVVVRLLARFMAVALSAFVASVPFQPRGHAHATVLVLTGATLLVRSGQVTPTRCADMLGSRPGGRPRGAAPEGITNVGSFQMEFD